MMASFARSFKPPPACLSPYRRPAMPGRSLSGSSELSTASNNSGDAVASAPGTPSAGTDAMENTKVRVDPPYVSPRVGDSRPIAIELPKIRKPSARTPPEPLSARGDVPGGYFPMHEDPKGRVHRPHPFHQDSVFARNHLHPDSAAMQVDRKDTAHVGSLTPSRAQPTMPVASYLAPGFHDSPLPMGKYYPSNYEQHQRGTAMRPARPTDARPPSGWHDSSAPLLGPQRPGDPAADADVRRRMQQYQRDMIAQAAMALGGSASKTANKPGASGSLADLPLKDAWLTVPSALKPASPRLDPLGSPGPVTPMDLESAAAGYLEHGAKPPQDRPPKEHKPAKENRPAAGPGGGASRSL